MISNREFVDELRASLGNNTMLTDDRYVRWLNFALLDLCGMHRKRAFPPKRFRALEGRMMLSSDIYNWKDMPIVSIINTAPLPQLTVTTTSGGPGSTPDLFSDWIVEVTGYTGTAPEGLIGQQRLCINSDTGVGPNDLLLYINSPFTVEPDVNTMISIYHRSYNIFGIDPDRNGSIMPPNSYSGNTPNEIWAIEKIEDVETGTPLTPKDWRELAGQSFYSKGIPSAFARRDTEILFDVAPDTDIIWRIWFYRMPVLFDVAALDTYVCELPEDWHEVVLLGAIWRGWKALMEPQRADSAYQMYINEATNRVDTHMLEEKHVMKGIRVKR
jgi:hypothetical protein